MLSKDFGANMNFSEMTFERGRAPSGWIQNDHRRSRRDLYEIWIRWTAMGVLGSILLVILESRSLAADRPIDFARDVQPILANHCWSCHGPDENGRQADLRLDLRESAIESGAIVLSNSVQSPLIDRISESDPERQMPPPATKKPLTEQQKEILRQWIAAGAVYSKHWSFETPIQPNFPDLSTSMDQPTNLIDRWVLDRLQREGLAHAPSADRETLLRRVSLDLTGLPPTLEEQDAFLSDTAPDAYERLVDRLLGSKAYAERMATQWLDLSRYADTNGYNNDEDRSMWPWRDWVIRAFDENMPFHQFLIEQLAGDLLPNPSQDQLIATGFLRNQGHNTEGGIIQEEYRVEYVADRVHTTSTVFLGLSMQCARCHDHKYDPISQSEYYQFFALLNNLEEKQASYSSFVAAEPFIRVPSAADSERLEALRIETESLQKILVSHEERVPQSFAIWLQSKSDQELAALWSVHPIHRISFDVETDSGPSNPIPSLDSVQPGIQGTIVGNVTWKEGRSGKSIELSGASGASYLDLGQLGSLNESQPFAISVWVRPEETQGMAILSKMDEVNQFRGYDLLIENGKVAMHLIHRWPENGIKVIAQTALTSNEWHHILLTYDGTKKAEGIQIYLDGKGTKIDVNANTLTDSIATEKTFHVGLREVSLPFHGQIDELQILTGPLQPHHVDELYRAQPLSQISDWVRTPWAELKPEQQSLLRQFTLQKIDTEFAAIAKKAEEIKKERESLESKLPAVMVMKEMNPPRETFLLKRGQYDQPGMPVTANVPSALRAFSNQQPSNRLELAQWLTHPSHPLTARVAVNRVWESLFGCGLVKTSEDFGVTGEFPSHPQLLDHLATSFIGSGWDVKQLHKQIVMSETYRQDSRISREALARDPENRLLARGPRYRLSAEAVRDNALAISGLLQRRVGGPSVKPYQPDGLWEDVTVERRGKYVADQGEGLFRRSMYTFWKRTCPPPSMVTFDAPNREVCIARRSRTNTPLQALVLMNDPTYIEAARALAQETLIHGGGEDIARIQYAYRRTLARSARPVEIPLFLNLLQASRHRFSEHPELADAWNHVGTVSPASDLAPVELAAWTVLASTLLNLDETVTKR